MQDLIRYESNDAHLAYLGKSIEKCIKGEVRTASIIKFYFDNQAMKLILLSLCLLGAAVFAEEAQETYPFDFDYTQLKSIWEAPEYAHLRSKTLGDDPRAGRIVGGQLAHAGQFPHHVLLVIDGALYWCGGSLIYENWVLTVRCNIELTCRP